MTETDLHAAITAGKAKLGKDLVILGHHYQRADVLQHADILGDSLKLSQEALALKAPYVIFCGVHFMAETADILTPPEQQISLPDLSAGCEMADMAHIRDVEEAWNDATAAGLKNIIPVTYINSSAAIKAFVGRHGGVICTSSNAENILTWALEHGEHVFFFPDQHLGRNVSKKLGLSVDQDMALWKPSAYLGGLTQERLAASKVWLWEGHCPVHALFSLQQIKRFRAEAPQGKVLVHPECAMEVVDHADLVGSTEYIVKTVAQSPVGSQWAIGTEKHLVERLISQYPDRKISSLNPFSCLCATMNRISLQALAHVVQQLADQQVLVNPIKVDEPIRSEARAALDRMFALT